MDDGSKPKRQMCEAMINVLTHLNIRFIEAESSEVSKNSLDSLNKQTSKVLDITKRWLQKLKENLLEKKLNVIIPTLNCFTEFKKLVKTVKHNYEKTVKPNYEKTKTIGGTTIKELKRQIEDDEEELNRQIKELEDELTPDELNTLNDKLDKLLLDEEIDEMVKAANPEDCSEKGCSIMGGITRRKRKHANKKKKTKRNRTKRR